MAGKKKQRKAASRRLDLIERRWLLGLKVVLSILLILCAFIDGGLLVRMVLATGAIQGVLLTRG